LLYLLILYGSSLLFPLTIEFIQATATEAN
jgi:hypothetical protein